MKTKNHPLLTTLAVLAVAYQAVAQGTAFTYQGQLLSNGSPASGAYNLTFSLFNANTGGVADAGPVTNNGVIVSNGLFTVPIDFGPGVFIGATNWLEIGVQAASDLTFTTLTPRQQLTPVPFAIMANTASNLLGTLPAAQLSGTILLPQLPARVLLNRESDVSLAGSFNGDGAGLTNLDASQLVSIGNGNSGSTGNFFVGTNAGNATQTGTENLAFSPGALAQNATGSYNSAVSLGALTLNTTGSANTAGGLSALALQTTPSYNTGWGWEALYWNTTGSNDTATGAAALTGAVTGETGSENTADGQAALAGISSGSSNTASGYNALALTTTGNANTANGANSMYYNTTGSNNSVNGYGALVANTIGSYNVADGFSAALYVETGSSNTALGSFAGVNWTSSESNNIAIGNAGFEGENNITRIGQLQTATYLAGVVISSNGFASCATNSVAAITASAWGNTNTLNGFIWLSGATNMTIFDSQSNIVVGPQSITNLGYSIPFPICAGGGVTNSSISFTFHAE
jgi:hypothetical protein